MKNSSTALGILGGVAVGSILGILFAPEKGCETRKKIKDKGTDLKNSLKDSLYDLSDKFLKSIEDIEEDTSALFADDEQKMEDQKNKFVNLKDN